MLGNISGQRLEKGFALLVVTLDGTLIAVAGELWDRRREKTCGNELAFGGNATGSHKFLWF